MARILLIDNEGSDVTGLIRLLSDIEPGGIDYVTCAEEALTCIKEALGSEPIGEETKLIEEVTEEVKVELAKPLEEITGELAKPTGGPYGAIVFDLHLGGYGADVDGDELLYLLDGRLDQAISRYPIDPEVLMEHLTSYDDLRKLPNLREDVIELLEETYDTIQDYFDFVRAFKESDCKKIIFSGSYSEGQYPTAELDAIVIKDPANGQCERDIVSALIGLGVIDDIGRVEQILEEGDEQDYFFGNLEAPVRRYFFDD